MTYPRMKRIFQSYQINVLDFRGEKVRYVVDGNGGRLYFYTDLCRVAHRGRSYIPRGLRGSDDYSLAIIKGRMRGSGRYVVVSLHGLIVLAESVASPALRMLARQIADGLSDEAGSTTGPDGKPAESADDAPSGQEDRSDGDTYSDLLAYTFGGDEAAYTFSDAQGHTHTIVLGFRAALHMLSVLALYIGDHEDGQGARLTPETRRSIIGRATRLFAVTDRLPEDGEARR